jgi:hypothetical protein
VSELFNIHQYNLSVAIWVGFLALFGIASDNGVIFATYPNQRFKQDKPDSIQAVRQATIAASIRRTRPALMTSATTILALIPVFYFDWCRLGYHGSNGYSAIWRNIVGCHKHFSCACFLLLDKITWHSK